MPTHRLVDPFGLLFGVALPLAAAGAGVLLTKLWTHRLPARIATHWTGHRVDSLAAPMSAAGTFALVMVLVAGGIGFITAFAQALLLMRRVMLVLGTTVLGIMFTIQVTLLAVQLDHADVTGVRLPWWSIPLGALCGLAVGTLGASRLRDYRVRTPAAQPPAPNLLRIPAAGPVRATAGFGATGVTVFVTVTFAALVAGCLAAKTAWPAAAAAPVLLIVAGLMRFDITADPSGLTVRNFGMTSLRVDTAEITGARVVEVNPFRDYGGWGLRRKGRGEYGIVTTTGPAVSVETASGLTLVVTTDRARTLAGAINAWADRG